MIDRSERNHIIKDIATKPGSNVALLRSYTGAMYSNQLNFNKTEQIISLLCKEIFMSFPVVIYTPKNFYLTEALDEKIEILQAAGLIDHWHSQIIDPRFLKLRESAEPKGIKLETLSGCFFTWIICCLISFSTFLGELLIGKLTKKSKNSLKFEVQNVINDE